MTGTAAERLLNVSDQEEQADSERRETLAEVKALRSELAALRGQLDRPRT